MKMAAMISRRGSSTLFFCLLALMAGRVNATDLTIYLTGKFIEPTCQWVSGDDNLTVTFDPIDVSQLQNTGAAGIKPFSIGLTGCTAGLSLATFTFSGTPDLTDGQRYQNTGSATGVAVELESSDGQTIGANGTNNTRNAVIIGGNATLNLQAGYWRLATGTVSPGKVTAAAIVTATYN